METVNSVVNAASAAIFGKTTSNEATTTHNETGGQEPVSGVKGEGTADEPFDKGNEATTAPSTTPAKADDPASEDPATTTKDDGPATTTKDEEELKPTHHGSHKNPKDVNPESTAAITANDKHPLVERGELPHGSNALKAADTKAAGSDAKASGAETPPIAEPAKPAEESTPSKSTKSPEVSPSPSGKKVSKLGKLKEKLHMGSGSKNL